MAIDWGDGSVGSFVGIQSQSEAISKRMEVSSWAPQQLKTRQKTDLFSFACLSLCPKPWIFYSVTIGLFLAFWRMTGNRGYEAIANALTIPSMDRPMDKTDPDCDPFRGWQWRSEPNKYGITTDWQTGGRRLTIIRMRQTNRVKIDFHYFKYSNQTKLVENNLNVGFELIISWIAFIRSMINTTVTTSVHTYDCRQHLWIDPLFCRLFYFILFFVIKPIFFCYIRHE